MYLKHHTKGIIIFSKADGGDSVRLSLFTENFGLINARVQGARNLKSKLRAGAQDFTFGEFSLVHGKTGWKVVSTRSEKNLFEIFKNYPDKLAIVCNILNLVRKLVDEESQKNLFSIVENFFLFLESKLPKSVFEMPQSQKTPFGNDEIALAECLTLMRILHCLGYMRHDPELSVPISSSEISSSDLQSIAPRRSQIIRLINESLKAT